MILDWDKLGSLRTSTASSLPGFTMTKLWGQAVIFGLHLDKREPNQQIIVKRPDDASGKTANKRTTNMATM